MPSLFIFNSGTNFILALKAVASRGTSSSCAMALTIIFQAMTSLAITFWFFSSLTWTGKLYHFYLLKMLLCNLCVLASNTRATFRAYLTYFKAITIFFKTMWFLTITSFSTFNWSCHFSDSWLILAILSLRFLFYFLFRSHLRLLLLRNHLWRILLLLLDSWT